ncbi:MAG: hypothetical protein IJU16_06005 [Clostridia bacterium]|nr:hypothetical protein [Clostridia bacterium]
MAIEPNVTPDGSQVSFDPTRKLTVKRTGRQIMWLQILLRATGIIVLALFLLALLLYLFSLFSNQAGRFTVSTSDGSKGLILSETADFEHPSGMLRGAAVEDMDNITYEWLPGDLDETDGEHNGEDYIAYTFYVRNTGIYDIGYNATLDIEYVKLNADEAVRVMVYRNGEPTVYCKPNKETGEAEVDPAVQPIPFVSTTTVMEYDNELFSVGDTDKYTVVVWLEGEDPECVNDIMGGEMKMSMTVRSVDLEEAVLV